MARVTVRVGDIVEIPLDNGKKAFAQYVYRDKNFGPLVQVFRLVSNETPPIETIVASGPLFPPVITGVQGAIKAKWWRVIGHSPVTEFDFPTFKSGTPDKSGKVQVWWLYDGQETTRVGALPSNAQDCELLIVWAQDTLEKRIETGENPFASR